MCWGYYKSLLLNLIIINLGVWGYSPTSKMEKNKRYNSSILISFLVSAYALTVLAEQVLKDFNIFVMLENIFYNYLNGVYIKI